MAKNTFKLTAKAQLTLRKEYLEHLGISPGADVVIDKRPGELVLRARPTGKISDIFGMLKRPGQPRLSIEEIKRATEDAWAGKR